MFDGTFGRIAGVQPDAGGRRIGRQGHARPRSGVGLPLPASPRAGSGRRPLRHLRPAHAQALPRRRRTAFERGEQRIERARPPRGEREEAVEVPADLQVEQGGGLLDETPRAAGQELQVALALHVVPDLVEAPGAAPWMCRSRSPRPRTRSAVSTLPTRSRTRRSPSASSASTRNPHGPIPGRGPVLSGHADTSAGHGPVFRLRGCFRWKPGPESLPELHERGVPAIVEGDGSRQSLEQG